MNICTSRLNFYTTQKMFLIFLAIVLSGCVTVQSSNSIRNDGIYIQESFSSKGKDRIVYQFAPGNKIYTIQQKHLSDAYVALWARDTSRNALLYTIRDRKLKIYSHITDQQRLSKRRGLTNANTLVNSKFYTFTESGIKFEFQVDAKKAKKTNRVMDIYSKQGELLFSDELEGINIVAESRFILKYSDHYRLYDTQYNTELLNADYMEKLKETDDLIMAYQPSGFGVVDSLGKVVLSFIYDDMMDLGKGKIAVMFDGVWSIRDVNNNILAILKKGQKPTGKVIAGSVIPLFERGKIKFYSLLTKQYFNFSASLSSSVSSSDTFFKAAKTNKWVLLKNDGNKVLSFYVSSVHHAYGYIIATDTKGTSIVFTEDSKQYSKGVKGILSPIRGQDYVLYSSVMPLLELTRGSRKGITDLRGNILVEPTYHSIEYLGNNHFLLDNGKEGSTRQIYIQGKGITTLPIVSADYFDGDAIIVRDQNKKYGLWSTLQSDWVLKPQDYDLIESGRASQYLKYKVNQGMSHRYGVIKEDGSLVSPANLTGTVTIEGDYLYNKKGKQITVYQLPDMREVMNVKGNKVMIEDDHYFVVSKNKSN